LEKPAPEPTYDAIELEPVGPCIGAWVRGVDPADGANEILRTDLRNALYDWKVLFFRTDGITRAEHLAFASSWGEIERFQFTPSNDGTEPTRLERNGEVSGYENVWHTDGTFMARPPSFAVLRAVEIPPLGGDTLWADMGVAYDGLSDEIKSRIESLTATHDTSTTYARTLSAERLARMQEQYPPVSHPVVRLHPVTGRRTIFVNEAFTQRLDGLESDEGDQLLQHLFAQATFPEYQCRLRWDTATVAVWDEAATQHYAAADYWPNRRAVERYATVGDTVVGPLSANASCPATA
jgi:taurine dioxygenase